MTSTTPTITNLRLQARSLGIPRYSVLKRGQLVKALREARKKETGEDILRLLPPDLAGLVLEGFPAEQFQEETQKSWRGVKAAKKSALQNCCQHSANGMRCFAAAKAKKIPVGGGCDLVCVKQVAEVFVALAKSEQQGESKTVLEGEAKAGIAVISSSLVRGWTQWQVMVQMTVPIAESPRNFGRMLIFSDYDAKYGISQAEKEEQEQTVVSIAPLIPEPARRFFDLWRKSPTYRTLSFAREQMTLTSMEDLNPDAEGILWRPPIHSARFALAYPVAFDYLGAAETNYRSVSCGSNSFLKAVPWVTWKGKEFLSLYLGAAKTAPCPEEILMTVDAHIE